MKRNSIIAVFAVMVSFLLVLSGCVQEVETDPNLEITDIAAVVSSAQDLTELNKYPNLQKLDLRGSTCYGDIMEYISSHPQVDVTYDVSLGGETYSQETAHLELVDGSFTVEELLRTLPYLPELTSVDLPATTLEFQAITQIQEVFPDIAFDYTLKINNQTISPDANSLDLSGLLPEQLDEILNYLPLLPDVKTIELMDSQGHSALGFSDVRKIMDAAPDAFVNYSFELFGNTLSTTDERVEYINTYIGNEGIDQIREALNIMPNCTYFLMDTCGVDNEVMSQLRDDYQNSTKIVWRVWLVEEDYSSRLYLRCGSYLTDTHRVRTTYVNDTNSHLLNYCTETKYLDVGHVWNLSQCEFISYMPELEVCIIAITAITDITPLANHEKLEYLELFSTDIEDLTPLESCPNIEHLNISNMPLVKDITPLYSLTKLKRLRMVDSPLIPYDQKVEIAEVLPDCAMLNMGHFPTAWFWRYEDPGKTIKVERYALLCEQMEYTIDALEYGIP